jgi:hypothetical protein
MGQSQCVYEPCTNVSYVLLLLFYYGHLCPGQSRCMCDFSIDTLRKERIKGNINPLYSEIHFINFQFTIYLLLMLILLILMFSLLHLQNVTRSRLRL